MLHGIYILKNECCLAYIILFSFEPWNSSPAYPLSGFSPFGNEQTQTLTFCLPNVNFISILQKQK